jgi:nucleotide-binding universal stress UspA family protein
MSFIIQMKASDDSNNISDHDKISRILVPIDGSELSRKAADYAIFLSSKLGTELCVIHVANDIPMSIMWVHMGFMTLRHPMK